MKSRTLHNLGRERFGGLSATEYVAKLQAILGIRWPRYIRLTQHFIQQKYGNTFPIYKSMTPDNITDYYQNNLPYLGISLDEEVAHIMCVSYNRTWLLKALCPVSNVISFIGTRNCIYIDFENPEDEEGVRISVIEKELIIDPIGLAIKLIPVQPVPRAKLPVPYDRWVVV